VVYDWVVVGAGFAGCVLAERLATQRNERVLLIDRRSHIGGNAYDEYNEHGILMHRYGPHIFHTNSLQIIKYLSQFTKWRAYEHRVLGSVDNKLVPIPINRTTINEICGVNLQTDNEVEAFLAARAAPIDTIKTSKDVVISRVGVELYEKFFEGYTRKQWGLDPSQLDKSVTARVPTRANVDDRYFTDKYQYMPLDGYTKMFKRMVSSPNIDISLDTNYRDLDVSYKKLIYTGPIDEYYDLRYGALPYRSIRFDHQTLNQSWFQQVGTVNYPQSRDYTRITEYKHLTGQVHDKTTITYEYPVADGDPYYPIPNDANQALFKRYEALAAAEQNVLFVGRLANYRYYNMDQVVGQALSVFSKMAPVSSVAARAKARVQPERPTA
jgi:UDP-galactopyranose mutase